MPVESPSLFADVIREHLALKERNAGLEHAMPLNRYKADDPFNNHPLFKTEEQARLEETMDGVEPDADLAALTWGGADGDAETADPEDTLWGRSRDFDWGD